MRTLLLSLLCVVLLHDASWAQARYAYANHGQLAANLRCPLSNQHAMVLVGPPKAYRLGILIYSLYTVYQYRIGFSAVIANPQYTDPSLGVLDDTNSILLGSGQSFTSTHPSIFTNTFLCQSTGTVQQVGVEVLELLAR